MTGLLHHFLLLLSRAFHFIPSVANRYPIPPNFPLVFFIFPFLFSFTPTSLFLLCKSLILHPLLSVLPCPHVPPSLSYFPLIFCLQPGWPGLALRWLEGQRHLRTSSAI